jgi:hypothetical protein
MGSILNSAELSRRSTIARRVASQMTPSMLKTNPMKTNLISPREAIMTPMTMAATFPSVLRLGGWVPSTQVASRVTTGVVAYMEKGD